MREDHSDFGSWPGLLGSDGETGKEEEEDEDGDCGMTLAVGSKGNKGWRSLGKP